MRFFWCKDPKIYEELLIDPIFRMAGEETYARPPFGIRAEKGASIPEKLESCWKGEVHFPSSEYFSPFKSQDVNGNFAAISKEGKAITDTLGVQQLYAVEDYLITDSFRLAVRHSKDKTLNLKVIGYLCHQDFYPGEETILEKIKRIPTVSFKFEAPEKLDFSKVFEKYHKGINKNNSILLYSGGTDSSIIRKFFPDLKTLTLKSPSTAESVIEKGDYVLEIPDYYEIELLDYPIDLGSACVQVLAAKTIKEGFPWAEYIITGDGPDEIFGGYPRFKDYPALEYSLDELKYYQLPKITQAHTDYRQIIRAPFLDLNIIAYVRKHPTIVQYCKEYLRREFPYLYKEKKPWKVMSLSRKEKRDLIYDWLYYYFL